MPRKALRCCVELDIHTVTCPGVYLPHRNDVYLSITLFRGQYRRTQLYSPSFPLVYHEKFRFDKLFYTAYQPQQVADALENDHIRIELVQLSDVRECGRLLAYFECNAKDFLYPYPQYAISHGSCAERQILLERTLEFPGIAPKLEFSTKTTLTEVDQLVATSAVVDSGLMSDSYSDYRPRSSRSPARRRSLSRHRSKSRSKSKTKKRSKSPCASYRHRRPTMSSISHSRSTSPCLRSLNASLRDFSLCESRDDDNEKPPFVVRKVESGLIGRSPGTRHPRPHTLRCSRSGSRSKSKSPSRYKSGGGYLDDDYRLVGRKYTHRHKVVREPATDYSSYSDDEYDEVLSDVSDPGPFTPRARSATRSAVYRRARSPSPILNRQSLRDRFEDDYLTNVIERKVDAAIKKNRSSFEAPDRPSSRGSRHDEDFQRIKDMERDLEISRNRSFVHINDGEYWTQKAAEYKGKSHRDVFNENLQKVYTDMYTTSKKSQKFDERVY